MRMAYGLHRRGDFLRWVQAAQSMVFLSAEELVILVVEFWAAVDGKSVPASAILQDSDARAAVDFQLVAQPVAHESVEQLSNYGD